MQRLLDILRSGLLRAQRMACQPQLRKRNGRSTYARVEFWRATVDNLRLKPERRLVDLNTASWNQVSSWLVQIRLLQTAA